MNKNDCMIKIYNEGRSICEFTEAVRVLERYICPPLSSAGVNIEEYAKKLFSQSEILMLQKEADIIGISAFYANDKRGRAYLSFFAVEKHLEGRGFGKKLLRFSEERAKALGMNKMCLEVSDLNQNAIGFYRKMGYAISKRASEHSCFMEKNFGKGKREYV